MPVSRHLPMIAVAFLLAIFSIVEVTAQYTCDTIFKGNFQVTPPQLPSVCSAIINYPIAVPSTTCQSVIEATKLGILGTATGALTETCRIAVATAMCSVTFPRCTPPATPGGSATASRPCRSVCVRIQSACSDPTDAALLGQFSSYMTPCTDPTAWDDDPATCWQGPQNVVDAQVLRARCQPYAGSVCAHDTPGDVYIPAGVPPQVLEATAKAQQFLFAVSPRTTGCDVLMQGFTCARTFMQCENFPVAIGRTVALPRLPCRDFCTKFNTACRPLFQISPALERIVPNCEAATFRQVVACDGTTVLSPGQPDYPPAAAPRTFFTPDGTISSECSRWADGTGAIASAVTQVNAICPAPLVKPDDPSTPTLLDGACANPCPIPIFTPSEYAKQDRIALGVSTVSLVLLLFLVITMLVFPQHRAKRYLLFVLISGTITTLAIWITLLRAKGMNKHGAESLCKNNAMEYHMEGYCLGQSLFFVYFICAALTWWLVQAFDVFSKVVLGHRVIKGSTTAFRREICFHIFGWGVPLIPIIALLSYNQLGGYLIGQPFCFMGPSRNDADATDANFYFMIIPMFVCTCIGVLLMCATAARLALSAYRARNNGVSNPNPWGPYLRVVLFIIVMTYIWTFMFVYKLMANSNKPKWRASVQSFFQCLLFTQNIQPGTNCGIVPQDRVARSLIESLIVTATVPGILLFLFLGTNASFYTCWAGLFYRVCGCARFSKFANEGMDTTNHRTTERSTSGNPRSSLSGASGMLGTTSVSMGHHSSVPAGSTLTVSAAGAVETRPSISPRAQRNSLNGGQAAAAAAAAAHHAHQATIFAKSNRYRDARGGTLVPNRLAAGSSGLGSASEHGGEFIIELTPFDSASDTGAEDTHEDVLPPAPPLETYQEVDEPSPSEVGAETEVRGAGSLARMPIAEEPEEDLNAAEAEAATSAPTATAADVTAAPEAEAEPAVQDAPAKEDVAAAAPVEEAAAPAEAAPAEAAPAEAAPAETASAGQQGSSDEAVSSPLPPADAAAAPADGAEGL